MCSREEGSRERGLKLQKKGMCNREKRLREKGVKYPKKEKMGFFFLRLYNLKPVCEGPDITKED